MTIGVTSVLAATALTGCGLRDTVVGIHPAPVESTGGAPLTVDAATRITTRVLADVATAEAQVGDEGTAARQGVLTGTALAMSLAELKVGTTPAPSAPPVERADDPTILALSRGMEWPRVILATTLDAQTNTRYLHALTSGSASEPFILAARVPMLAGTTLPSLGEVGQGVEIVAPDDASGLVLAPSAAVTDYAAALAFPVPTEANAVVPAKDSYATAQITTAQEQSDALGELATYTIAHTAVAQDTLAVRLADGGVVVFGHLTRLDTIAVTEQGENITIPEELKSLVGDVTTAKTLEIGAVEAVALLVPTSGEVSAIGIQDQREHGTTT
ncbi:MAG: hypothetical protein KBB39_03300 [Phycicoccus sp.]|nr:hypothetical protein [Phycicoccus sp.]